MRESGLNLNFLGTLTLVILIFFLWQTTFIYPLKILVVFFHESSHALAALLTGGEVKSLELSANAGGQVMALGGSRFITLSAGYLGSLCWGLFIFYIAVSTHSDRWLMAFLGLVLLVITVLFWQQSVCDGFWCGDGGNDVDCRESIQCGSNDFLLRLIGLTNMLYVPLDIYSDTIQRSQLRSDAFMLAEEFGGSSILWGGLWLVISLALIVFCFYRLSKLKKY